MENMTIGLGFVGIVKVGGHEFCSHKKRGPRFIKSKKSCTNRPFEKTYGNNSNQKFSKQLSN